MKKIIFIFMMLYTLSISASNIKADTVTVDNSKIAKLIEDKTTTSTGKLVLHYYFIYNGELVKTNKSVAEKYTLCKKHGVRIALAMVIRGKSKRIILD